MAEPSTRQPSPPKGCTSFELTLPTHCMTPSRYTVASDTVDETLYQPPNAVLQHPTHRRGRYIAMARRRGAESGKDGADLSPVTARWCQAPSNNIAFVTALQLRCPNTASKPRHQDIEFFRDQSSVQKICNGASSSYSKTSPPHPTLRMPFIVMVRRW